MPEEEQTLTKYATDADKSVRGKICYLPTQWIWWVVLPIRWCVAWLAGAMFGQAARRMMWRKILTPANFLTSARFLFLWLAVSAFFRNETLAVQTNFLFIAIITDFFDGPLARNNNEVTELGTYMDHIGDWSVVLWVIFLNFWFGTLPLPYLVVAFGILPILLLIYVAKFRKLYDHESTWLMNVSAFAAEELQTDVWGRLQFGFLVVALFGGLFAEAARDEAFLLRGLINSIPDYAKTFVVGTCLALYLYIGGYSTRDGLDYSEAKIKKFREKLKKIKNAPL